MRKRLAFIFSLQGCGPKSMADVCSYLGAVSGCLVWDSEFALAMVAIPLTQHGAR